jgi:hypothetical protein
MSAPPKPPPAARIAASMKLDAEVRKLLLDDPTPDVFLIRLEEAGHLHEALAFMARWMAKRVAVWWGCQCVRHLRRESPLPPEEEEALRAAVQWVVDPSEPNRRVADVVGAKVTAQKTAGCLAIAAAWSGGSMTPPDFPVVKPPEIATARTIGDALFAAAQVPPERCPNTCKLFLDLGRQILKGKNLWQ